MNSLFNFVTENKMALHKIFLVVSFVLIFIKPIYGFAVFAASITFLAYSDQIKEFVDRDQSQEDE